jgi:hypothetical protein
MAFGGAKGNAWFGDLWPWTRTPHLPVVGFRLPPPPPPALNIMACRRRRRRTPLPWHAGLRYKDARWPPGTGQAWLIPSQAPAVARNNVASLVVQAEHGGRHG